MTAHRHPFTRPMICTADQLPALGSASDYGRLHQLLDACWNECEQCFAAAAAEIANHPGAVLTLRRACALQQTGQLRWPYGSDAAGAEISKLGSIDKTTLRKITEAGGRMWVNNARLFQQLDPIAKCDGQPGILHRDRPNRPPTAQPRR